MLPFVLVQKKGCKFISYSRSSWILPPSKVDLSDKLSFQVLHSNSHPSFVAAATAPWTCERCLRYLRTQRNCIKIGWPSCTVTRYKLYDKLRMSFVMLHSPSTWFFMCELQAGGLPCRSSSGTLLSASSCLLNQSPDGIVCTLWLWTKEHGLNQQSEYLFKWFLGSSRYLPQLRLMHSIWCLS